MRQTVIIIALLGWAYTAYAYPALFAKSHACTAMPIEPMGEHKAPKQDPTITITVTDAKGTAVKAVCPGATYDVKVSYPEKRMNMVIASIGSLDGGKADLATAKTKCPNRLVAPQKEGQPKLAAYKTIWAVPDNATGEAKISVTSATGSSSAFLQSSLTVPISKAAECKAALTTATAGNKTSTGAEVAVAPTVAVAAPGEEPAASSSPAPAAASPSPPPAPKAGNAAGKAGVLAVVTAAFGGLVAAAMIL